MCDPLGPRHIGNNHESRSDPKGSDKSNSFSLSYWFYKSISFMIVDQERSPAKHHDHPSIEGFVDVVVDNTYPLNG